MGKKIAPVTIFLLAFAVRLVYILQLKATIFFDHFILDEAFYENWASRIAAGKWLGDKIFDALPLFPYLLGSSYKIFGHNLLIPRLIGIIASSFSCLLIYFTGSKFFEKRAGLIAASIAALYGPFIFYSGLLVAETIAIFLYLVVFWLLLGLLKRATFFKFLLFGLTIGLAALAKAGILLFLPVVLIWLSVTLDDKKKAIGGVVFALIGVAVVILPITLRNYLVSDDMIVLTSHTGLNFYIGNNKDADGRFKPPLWARSNIEGLSTDAKTLAEEEAGKPLSDAEVSKFYFNKSLKFIMGHPFKFIKLIGRKSFLFINRQELYDTAHYQIYMNYIPILKLPFLPFAVVGTLGLGGFFIAILQWRKIAPLYLFVITYTVSILSYFVNSRYRLPFAMAMIIFSGFLISWLLEKLEQKRYILAAIAIAICIIFSVIVYLPTGIETISTGYENLGNIYMEAQQWDNARVVFEKAIKHKNSDPKPYNDLGYICLVQDKLDEAEKFLRMSVERNPEYPFSHINLGLLYDKREDLKSAEREYKKAIRLNPNIPEAHNDLANVYEKTGRRMLAIEEYKEAIRLNPSNAKTHYNLGVIYGRQGELEKAKQEFEKALELEPDFTPAQEALSYF